MAKDPLEVELDALETELGPVLQPGRGSVKEPEVSEPLRRRVEEGQEVFVPRTSYRFNYRNPERLTADEARRRRFENFLNTERSASVSGNIKAQYARQRSEASAADARAFHPSARVTLNPRTVFGTEAVTFVSEGLRRHFMSPVLAIPCVQRVVRREVMFAKRKAGRGYRVPHVRSLLSHIGC